MKTLLLLSVFACTSMSFAAADPCKLLSPNEVASALGTSAVIARPDTDQDFPSCTFDFKDGGLQVSVITPAQTVLQGKTLLAFAQSGGDDGGGFQGLKPIPGLGDEAVGNSRNASTTVGEQTVTTQIGTLLVRRGNTIVLLLAFANNGAASSVTDQRLTKLATRALLRLP